MRNSLWDEHLERLSAIHDVAPRRSPSRTTLDPVDALRGEWNARPPGRLGRRLLVDVERYLDFFATARS
jgi:hypothetical protein